MLKFIFYRNTPYLVPGLNIDFNFLVRYIFAGPKYMSKKIISFVFPPACVSRWYKNKYTKLTISPFMNLQFKPSRNASWWLREREKNGIIFLYMYLGTGINIGLKNKSGYLSRVPNTGYSGNFEENFHSMNIIAQRKKIIKLARNSHD